ncbi:NF-kappa-B inhibitor delta-like [Alligator sinensis]|uniref:NF-kappa-B inhibitor delta-like n=1 Tax=Alligator sinensis TaxID=38654 RepID=A0A3Q0FR70_ALLSI|nr:NF-kappa-B inhibitor delta-like [Alligator sinensis]
MGPRLRAVLTPMSPRLLHLLAAQGLRAWAWAVAEVVKGVGGLEIREHQGKTPLLVAAAAAQAGIVGDLLVLGAEADAADQRGRTVLQAVMTSGIQVNVETRNFEG